MNPNMMNRNINFYGAGRGRTDNCNAGGGRSRTDNCNAGGDNRKHCHADCDKPEDANCGCGDDRQMNPMHGNCGCSDNCKTNSMRGNCGCGDDRQMNPMHGNCGCGDDRNMNSMRGNCGCGDGRNMNSMEGSCACTGHAHMTGRQYAETECAPLESMNQQQLLSYLNQVSFSMYDTVLFLDTHPCDQTALAYFHEMKHARKQALKLYQKKFGPLLLDNVDADCEWSWGNEPLPWERRC